MAISLDALKEQLKLLGHELAEEQIISILGDMGLGVDVASSAAAAPVAHFDRRDHTTAQPSPAGLTLAGEGYDAHPGPAFDQPPAGSNSSYLSSGAGHSGPSSSNMHAYGAHDPMAQLSADFGRTHISAGFAMAPSALSGAAGPSNQPYGGHLPASYLPPGATLSQPAGTVIQTQPLHHSDTTALPADPTSAAGTSVASRQPYEWYGQLAGAAANPHLKLAQPKLSSQRSLLQELDQSAARHAANKPDQEGRAGAAGTSTRPKKIDSRFFEEDSQEDSQEEDEAGGQDDVLARLRQLREAFPVPGERARGSGSSASAGLKSAEPRVAWEADTQRQGQGQQAQGSRHVEGGMGRDQSGLGSRGREYEALSGEEEEEEGDYAGRRYSDGVYGGDDTRHAYDARAPAAAGGREHSNKLSNHGQWAESVHLGRVVAGGVAADRAALRAAAVAALGPSSGGGAAAAAGSRQPKYSWQDHLRSTSPRSSVLSLPRSSAGTSAGGSRAPSVKGQGTGGAKKVDRVKRYQQLQQDWSNDKFLRFSQGSKPTPAARQAVPTTRKPLNFHTYFSALHALEASDRDQMLRQARSKTKEQMAKGMQYQAPTSKRRDDLRWEVRMKMQGQT